MRVENGVMTNFQMNDKCAAGTGRFLDVMARVLEVDVEQLGELGAQSTKYVGISSTCTVFAESEVISQLSMGTDKCDIINGIHKSVASRVAGLGFLLTSGPFDTSDRRTGRRPGRRCIGSGARYGFGAAQGSGGRLCRRPGGQETWLAGGLVQLQVPLRAGRGLWAERHVSREPGRRHRRMSIMIRGTLHIRAMFSYHLVMQLQMLLQHSTKSG